MSSPSYASSCPSSNGHVCRMPAVASWQVDNFVLSLGTFSFSSVHHLMGKRSSNLTGLSRYVLDALKSSQVATEITPENEAANRETSAVLTHSDSSKQQNEEQRPKKRQKVAMRAERPKYDATGLVPRYRNALQVPDHLQKCSLLSNPSPPILTLIYFGTCPYL